MYTINVLSSPQFLIQISEIVRLRYCSFSLYGQGVRGQHRIRMETKKVVLSLLIITVLKIVVVSSWCFVLWLFSLKANTKIKCVAQLQTAPLSMNTCEWANHSIHHVTKFERSQFLFPSQFHLNSDLDTYSHKQLHWIIYYQET